MIVKRNGEKFVLKEMTKGFNYGRDAMFMDSVKKEFGILDLKSESEAQVRTEVDQGQT